MELTLQLSENGIKAFAEMANEKISTIDQQIADLQEEKKPFLAIIERIKQQLSVNNDTNEITNTDNGHAKALQQSAHSIMTLSEIDYPFDDRYPSQAKWIITKNGKPMTTAEIVDTIIKYSPKLEIDRKKIMVSISGALGDYASRGKIYFRINSKAKGRAKFGLLIWKENK